jgi:hypothetical protein
VENWGERRFGYGRGRAFIGKDDYWMVGIDGYAIKGFWRAHDGALFGIKHVLTGRG